MTDLCDTCGYPTVLHDDGAHVNRCPNCAGTGGTYLTRASDSWLPCPHCGGSGITPEGATT